MKIISSLLKFPSVFLATGLLAITPLARATESFENAKNGAVSSISTEYGELKAEAGHAEIHNKAKTGSKSLHLMGGDDKSVTLTLTKPVTKDVKFSAWAERWTGRDPFSFKVEAIKNGKPVEIYNGDKNIKPGGLNTRIEATIPTGTTALKLTSSTPEKTGVILDDLYIVPTIPMKLEKMETATGVYPVMIRQDVNPILSLNIKTEGNLKPISLNNVTLDFTGTTNLDDIESVSLIKGQPNINDETGDVFGTTKQSKNKFIVTGNLPLEPGDNTFWVSVKPKKSANLDNKIVAKVDGVFLDKKPVAIADSCQANQRIGYAVAIPGDLKSQGFRIPGLVQSKKGTLIAVFDIRYKHNGDLPADIDVGISRSTDKGQSWSDMIVALSCKEMTGTKTSEGCGDPAILVDEKTGRIWIAGLWARGFHPIWHSKLGTTDPKDCGQFILAYSDDDGVTWSKPINITEQVKSIETGTGSDWGAIFQGPGNGICMKDGTLVFPAQYWSEDIVDKASGKTARRGHSTLIYSKDNGKTWKVGTGCKENTSEAQIVELKDGSLMINARDESRSGYRAVYTTKDLGKTWVKHPTSQNKETGLAEPTCQGSIQLINKGDGFERGLFFSNPDSHNGRKNMTVKASLNDGDAWRKNHALLYDNRNGAGYSALSPVDDKHIGVLYEGNRYLYFLRLPYKEILNKSDK